MTKRTSKIILFSSAIFSLILHAVSLDFAPWMDEVHIVEMGRLAISHSFESILTNSDGTFFAPLYYIGPCAHELAFRLLGPFGVRMLPMVALIIASILFRKWLRDNEYFSETIALLLSLNILWMPLFIQSTRLVRVDTAVIAISFGILVLIDVPNAIGNRKRLVSAAALSAISPFIWPSAILLFPLYAARYIVRSFAAERKTMLLLVDMAISMTAFCATVCLCILPVFDRLFPMIATFAKYFGSNGAPVSQSSSISLSGLCLNLAVLIVKETLRAPFFFLLLPFGFLTAIRREKLTMTAFLLSFVIALASGLHTFRNIFLFPYFILIFCLTIRIIEARLPMVTRTFLGLACLYGISTGPVAYALANAAKTTIYDFPINVASQKMKNDSQKILSLDYQTYYTGRIKHWRQMAYPTPSMNIADPACLLKKASFVIVPKHDRYNAIEESYTLYGVLRDLALSKARAERTQASKGFVARIGEAFAYDELPATVRDAFVARLRKAGFSPMDSCEKIWQGPNVSRPR